MGIFGNLFDLNHDGKMDTLEKAMEFSAFMHMVESTEKKDAAEDTPTFTPTTYADEDDGIDALEDAGIDPIEFDLMDDDERREALEGAGLDPDDYEF